MLHTVGFFVHSVVNNRGRNVDSVFGFVAEVSDEFANDHTGNHRLSHRVPTQAVKAVHIPASSFTSGKQAFQGGAFASGQRTDTTHRIVLSRTNRNPFLRRVHT